MSAATEAYAHTSAYMVDIVEGHDTLLKVLLEDELLAKFYDYFNGSSDLSGFFPGHWAQQGPDTSPRDRGRDWALDSLCSSWPVIKA